MRIVKFIINIAPNNKLIIYFILIKILIQIS